jgi:hypothetical protein
MAFAHPLPACLRAAARQQHHGNPHSLKPQGLLQHLAVRALANTTVRAVFRMDKALTIRTATASRCARLEIKDIDSLLTAGTNDGAEAAAYGSVRIQPNTGLAAQVIGILIGREKKPLHGLDAADFKRSLHI